jgi:hypothetical protein
MRTFLRFPTLIACLSLAAAAPAADSFEVGEGREADLPQGKEADGIRGDFVLRNDKVVALVSQNAPLRRANMSTFYGADGVTPGCLYDLALAGAQNDQIIYFGPTGQRGEVSWVRVVAEDDENAAAVETVITAAKNNGLYKRHEYRIRDGEYGIWIITTLRNEGKEPIKTKTKDAWTRFNESGQKDGIQWADAVDPADKAGYAYANLAFEDLKDEAPADEIELAPGQVVTWARFLAVGTSPAEAWSRVQRQRENKEGTLAVTVVDKDNAPVSAASISIVDEKNILKGYPDAKGEVSWILPVGKHQILVEDMGRPAFSQEVSISSGKTSRVTATLETATRLRFAITDEAGRSIPCKAQILAQGETKPVDLGPVMRAHGCRDQWHSERGDFSVQVPPGTYQVVVTRGIEYGHHTQAVTLLPGQEVEVKATLKRLVDTTGWVSADFHNHSTQSGDNICGTPDRLINIAAEHIEFAPTTEHNRIYDWRPIIEKLGLQNDIQTVVGMELTGSASHLNSFPLTVEPYLQDNGAPVYNLDPRISALTLRGWQGERDDRWVQINHPDNAFLFNDRNLDSMPDGGMVGIERVVDGMETENFIGDGVLADSPWTLNRPKGSLATKVSYVRQFIWLQLLNAGFRVKPVAVADAHTVFGNGVGGWRMYLPSKTDEPAKIDWTNDLAAQAKAGHYTLTTGPFLTVTTADGMLPGDDVKANGVVQLKVKVQCTDWVDIDRIQVLVNSRKEPTLNFTRKANPEMFKDGVVQFEQTITVPLQKDAHLIVVAVKDDGDLKTGYGSSDQARLRPMAYHTPFYVDVDGNGFQANGDTLGFDIPVARMTVDTVREKLGLPPEPKPEKSAAESGAPAAPVVK